MKTAMEQFLHAAASGDAVTACGLVTPEGQASLVQALGSPGSSCIQTIASVSATLSQDTKDGLATATISKVSVDGQTATVNAEDITSTQGDLSAFFGPGSPPTVLTQQPDGSWKISG